ncbi:MAG: PEGA domain-containing protein [Myxococcales bacterium]|nr:MAG: PEGA domain-containing protein [Myxococcales bacterium]
MSHIRSIPGLGDAGSGKKKVLIASVVVALVVMGAAAFFLKGDKSTDEQSSMGADQAQPVAAEAKLVEQSAAEDKSAEAPQAPTHPSEVELEIQVKPSSARIFVAGREYSNPMSASFPYADKAVPLRISKSGYEDIVRDISFRENQVFSFSMERNSKTHSKKAVPAAQKLEIKREKSTPKAPSVITPKSNDRFRDDF